jgi:hypothetical protein
MMAKIKTRTQVEVVEKKITLFETTDGKSFTSLEKAEKHQHTLDFEEIEVNIPVEIKLSELVDWARNLVEQHGPKAKWGVNPHTWGEGDYMIVKKRA